ncbi:hypothetical protein MKY14_04010 [Paenibacillus sp. FSL R5-0887]|uniref:hypothetical protein n=1 Tax=Paenibacillus TaxID=44249 RepID=UPI001588BFEC|nr:hypothetical protein [Paenibacillus odorifer]
METKKERLLSIFVWECSLCIIWIRGLIYYFHDSDKVLQITPEKVTVTNPELIDV